MKQHGDTKLAKLTEAVCERLASNRRVRRNLPQGGRLRIDRQLPFLCVYRFPAGGHDRGTRELVTTEAAYLAAPAAPPYHDDLAAMCRSIADLMREHFGLFLLLELWAEPLQGDRPPDSLWRPAFRIVTSEGDALRTTVETLRNSLQRVRVGWGDPRVELQDGVDPGPPWLPPLLRPSELRQHGQFAIGLAIDPVYRDPQTGDLFPLVLRQLRRELSPALRRAVFSFAGTKDADHDSHYDSFGPSTLVRASAEVDRQLCEVAESHDFLLQATPLNSIDAWQQFQQQGYRAAPKLYYRPLPYDPVLLKRRLYEIEIERLEDATLAFLFWEKQDELGRQLTALTDIDTPNFLYSSLQLYGQADADLLTLAESLMKLRTDHAIPADEWLRADEVAQAIREEVQRYRQADARFIAEVEIRDDIAAGIMVTKNKLLVARDVQLTPLRMQALLHHEVGTHLLTFINGRAQRFALVHAGLAGYETLQEGLAVLAEFVTGGLSASRVRTLAARVIAVQSLTERNSFEQTFARLVDGYGYGPRAAFNATLRVYRGGGLTKDVIYLRGLRDVINYLGHGYNIEPLLLGKIALRHVPFIQELRLRGVLDPPAILPRYLSDPHVAERFEQCRHATIEQLLRAAPDCRETCP